MRPCHSHSESMGLRFGCRIKIYNLIRGQQTNADETDERDGIGRGEVSRSVTTDLTVKAGKT